MQPERVAEIYCKKTKGHGSGYLVAPDLILTALHTLGDDNEELPLSSSCEIRLLDGKGAWTNWYAAKLAWPLKTQWQEHAKHDIALLRIKADAITSKAASLPLNWGFPASMREHTCEALGFPSGRIDEQGNPDLWPLKGHTDSYAGIAHQVLYVGLGANDLPTLSARFVESGFWPGFSGAGLFVDGHLVGVVKAVSNEEKFLTASRIERVWGIERFAKLIGLNTKIAKPRVARSRERRENDDRIHITDLRLDAFPESDLDQLTRHLRECNSISQATDLAALAQQLSPITRQLMSDSSIDSMVAASAETHTLSTLLTAVAEREGVTTAWNRLVLGLLALKAPIVPSDNLHELEALCSKFDPGCNLLSELFRRSIRDYSDTAFFPPQSWAEAIVLLCEMRGGGVKDPPLALLVEEVWREAPADQKAAIAEWRHQAGTVLHSRAVSASAVPAALSSSQPAYLAIEIENAIVQPGDGFSFGACLVVDDTVINLGSDQAKDEEALKRWVSRCGMSAHQHPQLKGRKLIFEFYLPEAMFNAAIDQWPAENDKLSLPLGIVHPLVFRSLWRRRDMSAREYQQEGRRLRALAVAGKCLPMHFVNAPDSDPIGLFAAIRADPSYPSVAFGFVPEGGHGQKLVTAAIMAGSAIMIWPSEAGIVASAIESDLRSVVQGDFQELPMRAYQRRVTARGRAGADTSQRAVQVFWDDFERSHGPIDEPLTDHALRLP